MKVKKTLFGDKCYIVSSAGKRLTRKYNYIEIYDVGCLYLAIYWDEGYSWIAFDKRTETLRKDLNIWKYTKLDGGYYLMLTNRDYKIWNSEGFVWEGIKEFEANVNCERYYIVQIDGLYYFVNKQFEPVSEGFKTLDSFDVFGYSVAYKDDHYVVLDQNLNVVVSFDNEITEVKPLSKEYFAATKQGKQGVYNKQGEEVVPSVYTSVEWQKGKYICVMYNKKYGLLDVLGNVIFEPVYDGVIETPTKFVVKEFVRKEVLKEAVK